MTSEVEACKAKSAPHQSDEDARIAEDAPEGETRRTDVIDLVENSLAVLDTLREEIRADLHLAGEEVRERWRRLEARLRAAEARARAPRQQGGADFAALVESAKSFWSEVRKKAL